MRRASEKSTTGRGPGQVGTHRSRGHASPPNTLLYRPQHAVSFDVSALWAPFGRLVRHRPRLGIWFDLNRVPYM